MTKKEFRKQRLEDKKINNVQQRNITLSRFYNLNSILGNNWAMFYVITGGRMTGKSYSVAKYILNEHKHLGDQSKNYWLRISDTSTKALLINKADKLFDPDLKRQYNLDLTTKGNEVYNRGKLICTCIPLSSFGKTKGVGYFDKDFTGHYNIVLDEFQLEEGERKTSFDILYNFIGMLENIARTTKSNIRVFLLGNTLEEASTILKAFNFLPEKFGRFYLKSKRCVIDNLEPTEEYLKDRKGSLADILGGDSMSNYTNQLTRDAKLITKQRVHIPQYIIKFGKQSNQWYTVWDNNIIRKYKNEKVNSTVAMKPYLNDTYHPERRQMVIDMFNAEAYKYDSLITQSYFSGALQLIKKS